MRWNIITETYKAQARKKEKMNKQIIAVIMTATMAVSSVTPVYASSPEFARSAEEWAQLRDNKLEYGELQGLIEEYNATVIQNQITYQKFRADYGDTREDVSQSYYDLADDIESAIDTPDSSDANYATAMISALSSANSARTLRESGDNNLEDSEIKRINNEMTIMTLTQTAQNNMVTYKINQLDIQKAKLNTQLAELRLQAAQIQASIGSSTSVDVYNAQQTLLSSKQAETTAQSTANTSHQKLIVMCGWGYDAQPEIGDIPEPDMAVIDTMNPTIDTQSAIENSYTVRSNEKQLANASQQSQKDKLTTSINNNKANIGTSVSTAYQNVISARDSYTYAQTYASLQHTNMNNMSVQYSVGSASKLDYDTQSVNTQIADIDLQEAKYNMFLAIQAYNWCIHGLASA